MKKFAKMAVATAIAGLGVGSAFAFPVFVPGTNSIEFQSYENHYRSAAACAQTNACLPTDAANDPTGYQRVNPAATGLTSVIAGDIFAGTVKVTGVLPGAFPNNVPSASMEFTGYFAQQVDTVTVTSELNAIIKFKTVGTDPFGVLTGDEMFKLYLDTTPDYNAAAAGTTFAHILAATNGGSDASFWGSLGIGTEGYAYTLDDLAIAGNDANFASKSYLGLDLITKGSAYNAGDLKKVNDESESLAGGESGSGALVCDAADLANPAVSCVDFTGNADIKKNTYYSLGAPFYYNVNDPLFLNKIPEPGSLALMGLALAGFGVVRRRKSA